MRSLKKLALLVAASALLAPLARADDPMSLAHSGRLFDAADLPVNGSRTFVFRLFTTQVPGAPGEALAWESVGCPVSVADGLYSVVLGVDCAGNATSGALTVAALPPGSARFLEVSVGAVTLLPRLRLGALPTASLAANAQALEGQALAQLDTRYVGTTGAQTIAGAKTFSADVTAGPGAHFVGSGTGLTNVNAAQVGGLTLAQLDTRYAPASGGSSTFTSGIVVGSTAAGCTPANAGAIAFDGTTFVGCNGSGWAPFTLAITPTLTSVTVTSGPAQGGTSITIQGANIRAGATVTVGGRSATVGTTTATTITITTPSSPTTGAKDVVVTNPGGYAAVLANAFTYYLTASTPSMWLKADSITGLSAGQEVASWSDSAGSRHMVKDGTGPTFQPGVKNGLPVVRFNGSHRMTRASAWSVLGGLIQLNSYAVFAVVRASSVTANSAIPWNDHEIYHIGQEYGSIFFRNNGPTIANHNCCGNGEDHVQTYATGTVAVGQFYVVSGRHEANQIFIKTDVNGETSTAAFGTNTNDVFRLGVSHNDGNYFYGDLGELLFYDSALTPASRAEVEGYLKAKWGI